MPAGCGWPFVFSSPACGLSAAPVGGGGAGAAGSPFFPSPATLLIAVHNLFVLVKLYYKKIMN